ncbi:MAG: DUF2061 domain-containing protein [Cellvibrionaceae bacterium]
MVETGVVKTVTFAAMHFSIAFAVAYLLTGSLVVGGAVALVEPAINTLAFYFHERLWKVWDRRKLQDRKLRKLQDSRKLQQALV